VRGSQLRAIFLAQVRPACAALVLKRPIRLFGRLLGEDVRRELQRAGKRRNKEEGQFRFHLW
jgi:hypothetical protein